MVIRAQRNSHPLTNGLSGVSCHSSSSCKAVGFSGVNSSLVESWNGTKWSKMSSPPASLDGVSCLSTASCVAVGSTAAPSYPASLIESWNGTKWKVVASPDLMEYFSGLSEVSCTSADFCIAVGSGISAPDNGDFPQAFIEAWNGSQWALEGPAGRTGFGNVLGGVSCTTVRSCLAVGSSSYPGFSETLTEHRGG